MRIKKALQAITDIIDNQNIVCVAWSGGKDSSVVLDLVLSAAAAHPCPTPIIITHANTGIENPEIAQYVGKELDSVRRFAKKHNIPVEIEISTPGISSSWAVKVIGGRALPSFCNNNRDCSVDLKVLPQKRLRKQIFKKYADRTAVTVIGTRFSESSVRNKKMQDRKESDVLPWTGKDKSLYLSPIANWSTDNVWQYLLEQQNSGTGYSDFKETFRIYSDATISTEVDATLLATGAKTPGCGPRFGCFLCCVTSDQSMENLIEGNPERYGYMRGLNDLQKYLLATQYDFERRDWFGRSIDDDGYITIGPDVYSPQMLEDLLLYCLTLDVEEQEVSYDEGIDRRFQIINAQTLIAIDAMWSLHGRHKPFHALYCYDLVYNKRQRFHVPKIAPIKPSKMPAPRKYYVGQAWEQNKESGLRNTTLELVNDSSSPCMATKTIGNGRIVMDCEISDLFEVNEETAWLILDPDMGELDTMLERFHKSSDYFSTHGYTHYVGLGAISISKGKEWVVDKILRRSNWKERNGLGPGVHYSEILNKTIEQKGKKQLFLFPDIYKLPRTVEIPVSLLEAVGA